jgi:hypothetical protein
MLYLADKLASQWSNKQACVDIILKHNINEIKLIGDAYEKRHGRSLEYAIKSAFSGHEETALLALICDPVDYYCKALKEAMVGIGTNEATINRLEIISVLYYSFI